MIQRRCPSGVTFRNLVRTTLAVAWCAAGVCGVRTDAVWARYYEYRFGPADSPAGYWLARKNYLDELDPAVRYPDARELTAFAAPGEYEPVTFVIYAARDIESVRIEVTDLNSGGCVIPKNNLDLRIVARAPRRFTYQSPPEDSRVVSRFLFEFKPFHLPARRFREIWLTIHVPKNAKPGMYSGKIHVRPANAPPKKIALSLEVFPFTLPAVSEKRYGVYHQVVPGGANPGRLERELADIREHGGTLIYPSLPVECAVTPSGEITFSYAKVKKGLAILRDAGFTGSVPILTGLPRLQRLLKLKDEELESDKTFLAAARRDIEGLKRVQREFPGLEIVLTHLDEVFSGNLLPRYIALTKAARQVPGFRFYITFHTVSDSADELRARLDPYVDIRGNHGYSFEWWLARGHTFQEYERELRDSGDEAWFYLNPNRIWRDAKFQRIVNGLYMWISPFSGRLDWGYTRPVGDPFNDLDGKSTDTGYVFWSGGDLVPTRDWEAWREGIDDVRYLLMLETLIEKRKHTGAAKAAALWLADVKRRIPKPQGLKYTAGPTPKRDAAESPFILAIRREFSSDDLQKIRYDAARHIIELLKK